MNLTKTESQAIYKAEAKFAQEHPEFSDLALLALNQWGKAEMTLTHAVAAQIQRAYEAGKAGEQVPSASLTNFVGNTIVRRKRA